MRCRRCVLTDAVPHVIFEDGLCQHCRRAPGAPVAAERKHARERFLSALRRRDGRDAGPEVLLAYSGGKDSTYALEILSRRFKLRVLAYTFDNGFLSEAAMANARRMTDALARGWIVQRFDPERLRRVLRASLEGGLHPEVSIERASPVCLSCIGIVKYSAIRIAVERGIPYVAFGWTPGQSPVARAYLPLDESLVRALEAPLRKALETAAGTDLSDWFLPPGTGAGDRRFPAFVHPAAFYPYREKAILDRLALLGWKRPAGLDSNSTNCRLNTLNVQAHLERYGFHPYIHELASLVRQGYLSRREALSRLRPVDAKIAGGLRRQLEED